MSTTAENLNVVAGYLAQRDVPELTPETVTVDVLVLLGSSLMQSMQLAASALRDGLAKRLLVSGGTGHSTQDLRDVVNGHPSYCTVPTAGRGEADIIHDILTGHLGVPDDLLIVENRSTNCGTNASESRRVLDALGVACQSLLVMQDPTMQRRSHAHFRRAWGDRPDVSITSFAPFVPVVQSDGDGYAIGGSTENVWSFERFTSLVLGEIPRLRDDENGYGPRGRNFIDRVDIPEAVLAAHTALAADYPQLVRPVL